MLHPQPLFEAGLKQLHRHLTTSSSPADRAGLQRPIKFATVVTDLTTCHNTWFHKDVDRCFVATDEAKQRALAMGIGQHKLTVHGLPIRPSFSQKLPSKQKLRQQLGMGLQKPAVLLVGMVLLLLLCLWYSKAVAIFLIMVGS